MATTNFVPSLTLLLVITASMFAVSVANKTQRPAPRKIIVGGSEYWRFGYNYTDWAIKNGHFYHRDTLVFKYDAPNGTNHPHSVYLFPNLLSFKSCDVKKAKMLANHTQGVGEGFQIVLKKHKPYYFGCGEKNGFHCSTGQMKFAVIPTVA